MDGLNGAGIVENGFTAGTFSTTVIVGAANGNGNFSGVLQDGGQSNGRGLAFTKIGTGTQILGGTNTYTHPTAVSNGTLVVNGSLAAGSLVYVAPAGKLGGNGTVNGAITLEGTISPGTSVGTLNTANETWDGGAAYQFELASATFSAGMDFLNITGTLALTATPGSPFTIKLVSMTNSTTPGLISDFNGNTSYTWVLATASGGITGFDPTAFVIDASAFANSHSAGTFSVANVGNSIYVKYTVTSLTPPVLSGWGHLSGGSFPFVFSGPSGQTYTVLGSTNVALPMSNWMVLTTGTFGGSPVTYTDTSATNSQRFYRIVSP
jgi:autotransporter-associated beta strand protein